MWYVCDVLYAVLYVCVCCFVVCGYAVSRRYIDVFYCDMFSVVNVYHDHLKFCVVCIDGQRYVGCGECYVINHSTLPLNNNANNIHMLPINQGVRLAVAHSPMAIGNFGGRLQ